MINKSSIQTNLTQLDQYFKESSSGKKPSDNRKVLYFSKLAIIELCGWIEESMDDIVLTCANRYITDKKNKAEMDEQVSHTWGFDYSSDFRKMLIHVMGIVNVERLESKVDADKLQTMKNEFGQLKPVRNTYSHTHIKGTPRIDAPSITLVRFTKVYTCLKDIERCVHKMTL